MFRSSAHTADAQVWSTSSASGASPGAKASGRARAPSRAKRAGTPGSVRPSSVSARAPLRTRYSAKRSRPNVYAPVSRSASPRGAPAAPNGRTEAPSSAPRPSVTPALRKYARPVVSSHCTIASSTRVRYTETEYDTRSPADAPRAPSSAPRARCGPSSRLNPPPAPVVPPGPGAAACSSVVVGVSNAVDTFAYTTSARAAA